MTYPENRPYKPYDNWHSALYCCIDWDGEIIFSGSWIRIDYRRCDWMVFYSLFGKSNQTPLMDVYTFTLIVDLLTTEGGMRVVQARK